LVGAVEKLRERLHKAELAVENSKSVSSVEDTKPTICNDERSQNICESGQYCEDVFGSRVELRCGRLDTNRWKYGRLKLLAFWIPNTIHQVGCYRSDA